MVIQGQGRRDGTWEARNVELDGERQGVLVVQPRLEIQDHPSEIVTSQRLNLRMKQMRFLPCYHLLQPVDFEEVAERHATSLAVSATA